MPTDPALPELRVLPDPEAVAEAAATEIAEGLRAAIAERGVAHWSTTGGSAAPPIYRHLGTSPLRERVDWSKVHVWWGDDRFVPTDHPESNVMPLEQILLVTGGDEARVRHAERRRVRARVRRRAPRRPAPPDAGAARRSRTGPGPRARPRPTPPRSRRTCPAGADGVPVFDVYLLGVGAGRASAVGVPGLGGLGPARSSSSACPAPTHVEPHLPRVTMHPRVIAAARARARW